MKITRIRDQWNKKLDDIDMQVLCNELQRIIGDYGYLSNVRIVNSSRIDISYNSSSFRVDTNVHGYNAQFNPYRKTKLGYVRTSIPTWEQRVEYNELIQRVLDNLSIKCTVKSGDYLIRLDKHNFVEQDWITQMPDFQRRTIAKGFRVESLE